MRQASLYLEKEDVELIGNCIRAVQRLDIFPDWEFKTLFGFDKEEFNDLLSKWPYADLSDINVANSILGTLNHLIGYPHNMDNELFEYTQTNYQDMKSSLKRIKIAVGNT